MKDRSDEVRVRVNAPRSQKKRKRTGSFVTFLTADSLMGLLVKFCSATVETVLQFVTLT